jgi:hypothetical protein
VSGLKRKTALARKRHNSTITLAAETVSRPGDLFVSFLIEKKKKTPELPSEDEY